MKRGGATKKMKKFPRIIDYLELNHPKVYELLNHLVLQGNLTPRRGGAITFLVPNADYLKKVEKVLESDDPEGAVDMILCLILTDLFQKPEDFAEKKDDIATLLGTRLLVKSVTPSKVIIEDGEISLDTKFVPFSRHGPAKRGNMAVWNLIKGSVKYEGVPKANPKPLKGAKMGGRGRPVRGGSEDAKQILRDKVRIIEQAQLNTVRSGQVSSNGKVICHLMNAVSAILRVISDPKNGFVDEYRTAKCVLTMHPEIDLYLLTNPLIFDPVRICKALEMGVAQDKNVDCCKEFCDTFVPELLKDEPALLLSNSGVRQARQQVDDVLRGIISRTSIRTADQVTNLYQQLDQTNMLDGVGPMYPECLASKFRSKAGLHLFLDEFCQNLWCKFRDVMEAPNLEAKYAAWKDYFHFVYTVYGDPSNLERSQICKTDRWGVKLDQNNIHMVIIPFLQMWALHIPCPSDDRVMLGAGEIPDPMSKELYGAHEKAMEELERHDNSALKVSEHCLAEIRAYMKANNGKLPDELSE
jgi:hypothetical protein